jgi:endo-1,4-beta-xylanase
MKFFVIIFFFGLLSVHSAIAQTGSCVYKIDSEWNTGASVSISITNTGTAPINGWNLRWQYANNKITNTWNATFSGANPYTATALTWNATIQSGQRISFGFQIDKNGGVAEKPSVIGSVCAALISSVASTSRSSVAASSLSISSRPSSVALSSMMSSVRMTSSFASSRSLSSAASSIAGVGVGLKDMVDFPMGVAVAAGNENNSILTDARQQAIVFPHYDQFSAENIMKMSYLHPSENTYSFSQADELIEFARTKGISVHAHVLVWHKDYQIPDWIKNFSGDTAAWNAMLKTHVQTIAAHFSGKVASWDVVNEALIDDGDNTGVNGYRNSLFYQKLGASFIDNAFIHARAADPVADLYYNDYNTEAYSPKTTNLFAMLDGMKIRNVPITGIGFQMHVFLDWPSIGDIEKTFQAIVSRGLKVKITELDVRANNFYSPTSPVYNSFTPEVAVLQKERYRQVVAAYLKVVPAAQRGGITIWGAWDTNSWVVKSGRTDWPLLFDVNYQAKPALQGVIDGLTGR